MNHTNDHDFQQFRGKFDDAMTPGPEFRAKMEKLLQSEQPAEAERISTVLASPSRPGSPVVIPEARRSHPLMIAAAVLTVFAVVVASVWVLSGEVLKGDYASAPSGIATLPADAPGTPGPDVLLKAERFPSISGVHDFFGMHGELLIVRAPVELQENRTNPTQEPNVNSDVLMAVDPNTGEIVWEHPYYGFSAIAATSNVLIGTQINWSVSTPNSQSYRQIVALDLSTGEELWATQGSPIDRWNSYPGVVVLNQVVVDATSDSTLVARNLNDGEIAWETEYDLGEGWLQQVSNAEGEEWNEQHYIVATIAWNDTLVLINGDGLVQIVDPNTGELTNSYQFDWSPKDTTASNHIELFSMDQGVVLYRLVSSSDGLRSEITAFNPTDGTHFWQLETEGQKFVDVATNGDIALQSATWEPASWLQRLFGNHGDSIRSLTWINGSTGETYLSTEPGKINSEYPPAAKTDGTYACSRTEEKKIICYDKTGTRFIAELEFAPQYDFDLVDGALYIPTQQGLYTVALP